MVLWLFSTEGQAGQKNNGLAQPDWPVASSVDSLHLGPGSAATGKGRASFPGHSPHLREPRQTVPECSRCSVTGSPRLGYEQQLVELPRMYFVLCQRVRVVFLSSSFSE